MVASFATAVVLHSVQRFCKQDLPNLTKELLYTFRRHWRLQSSKTVYQGLACSPDKLFKSLYWVRQAPARRWRVRSCFSVEKDDLKSCWVTALAHWLFFFIRTFLLLDFGFFFPLNFWVHSHSSLIFVCVFTFLILQGSMVCFFSQCSNFPRILSQDCAAAAYQISAMGSQIAELSG